MMCSSTTVGLGAAHRKGWILEIQVWLRTLQLLPSHASTPAPFMVIALHQFLRVCYESVFTHTIWYWPVHVDGRMLFCRAVGRMVPWNCCTLPHPDGCETVQHLFTRMHALFHARWELFFFLFSSSSSSPSYFFFRILGVHLGTSTSSLGIRI